ncbi:MAG: hypothetical protein PHP26_04865 [Syntrophomonas sp.]|nr:hypothetical protein [Syntrophomonas sp.]
MFPPSLEFPLVADIAVAANINTITISTNPINETTTDSASFCLIYYSENLTAIDISKINQVIWVVMV